MEQVGFFKKLALRALTLLQVVTIRFSNDRLYYYFTDLHFKTYYGVGLEDARNLSNFFQKELRAVSERHACMVVSVLYKNSKRKARYYKMAKEAFNKNLLAETYL